MKNTPDWTTEIDAIEEKLKAALTQLTTEMKAGLGKTREELLQLWETYDKLNVWLILLRKEIHKIQDELDEKTPDPRKARIEEIEKLLSQTH